MDMESPRTELLPMFKHGIRAVKNSPAGCLHIESNVLQVAAAHTTSSTRRMTTSSTRNPSRGIRPAAMKTGK